MEKIPPGVSCEPPLCIAQNILAREILDADLARNVIAKGIDEDVPWPAGETELAVGGLAEVGKNLAEHEVITVKLIDAVDEETVPDVEVLIPPEMVQGFGKFTGCPLGALLLGPFGTGLPPAKGTSGRDEAGTGAEDFVEEGFEETLVGFLHVRAGCPEVVPCGQELEWFGPFFEHGLGCFVVGGELHQG